MTRTIDVHNHLFPPEWTDYLEKSTGRITMKRTNPTSMIFYADGIPQVHISKAGHCDPEARLVDMDKYGIDVNILSLSIPSVEVLPEKEGVTWAKKINDYYASLCQKYPERFYAFAALPYQNVDEATKERERGFLSNSIKGFIGYLKTVHD